MKVSRGPDGCLLVMLTPIELNTLASGGTVHVLSEDRENYVFVASHYEGSRTFGPDPMTMVAARGFEMAAAAGEYVECLTPFCTRPINHAGECLTEANSVLMVNGFRCEARSKPGLLGERVRCSLRAGHVGQHCNLVARMEWDRYSAGQGEDVKPNAVTGDPTMTVSAAEMGMLADCAVAEYMKTFASACVRSDRPIQEPVFAVARESYRDGWLAGVAWMSRKFATGLNLPGQEKASGGAQSG